LDSIFTQLKYKEKGRYKRNFCCFESSPGGTKSLDLPTACYFFLDEKVTKKSRPTEICLINIRNSGKTKTRPAVAVLKQFVFLLGISSSNLDDKFLNGRYEIEFVDNRCIRCDRRGAARKQFIE
jgi:hypothetical protein